MSFILSLLIGKYAKIFWPIIGFLATLAYLKNLHNTIDDQEKEIANLKADYVILQQQDEANRLKCKLEIESQNDAIAHAHQKLKDAEVDAGIRIAEANATNTALSIKLDEQMDLIDAIETPKTCQAAIDLVVDVAVQHKWSTEKQSK